MDQPKHPLTLAEVAVIIDLLGRDFDPQAAFLVFDRVVQRVLGHKLLTVMRHVAATAEVERIYSPIRSAAAKLPDFPSLGSEAMIWLDCSTFFAIIHLPIPGSLISGTSLPREHDEILHLRTAV
jgi:hypothetical protein